MGCLEVMKCYFISQMTNQKSLCINDICKEKGKMKDESVLLSIIPVYQKWIVIEVKSGMNGTNKIRSCLLLCLFQHKQIEMAQ